MIRAHVTDNMAAGGMSVSVSLIMAPPEGALDCKPRILRLPGKDEPKWNVTWDDFDPYDPVEPSFTLDIEAARALLDALSHRFDGAEDTRALRRDYDAERKRTDKLTDALIGLAHELAAPGGIA